MDTILLNKIYVLGWREKQNSEQDGGIHEKRYVFLRTILIWMNCVGFRIIYTECYFKAILPLSCRPSICWRFSSTPTPYTNVTAPTPLYCHGYGSVSFTRSSKVQTSSRLRPLLQGGPFTVLSGSLFGIIQHKLPAPYSIGFAGGPGDLYLPWMELNLSIPRSIAVYQSRCLRSICVNSTLLWLRLY